MNPELLELLPELAGMAAVLIAIAGGLVYRRRSRPALTDTQADSKPSTSGVADATPPTDAGTRRGDAQPEAPSDPFETPTDPLARTAEPQKPPTRPFVESQTEPIPREPDPQTAPTPRPAEPRTPPAVGAQKSLLERFTAALAGSRAALQDRLDTLFKSGKINDSLFEELEETLLTADVGLATAQHLVGQLKTGVGASPPQAESLRAQLQAGMVELLQAVHQPLQPLPKAGPLVILVVGVNGSGKTTTIGKLAARYRAQGTRVMLAAADTYRAAAAEQLAVWAERSGADLVRQAEGTDPGAVVYAALESALAKGHQVVIVDTAGRLQTRQPLMEQLSKLRRVIGKKVPGGPHETLLVLDGTTGQNGLSQAQHFHKATPLTGAVVTKLDGTAKGGMVLSLAHEHHLPIKLVGLGEQTDDLHDFDPQAFVSALS